MRITALAVMAGLCLAPALPALAQQPDGQPQPSPQPSSSQQPLTREEMEQALAERDRLIADLQRRLAALEAQRGVQNPAPEATTEATPPAPSAPVQTAQAAPPAGAAAAAKGDEDVELQALSRGLVERGLLLMPTWGIEVSPSATYAHTQTQGLTLVQTPEGIQTVDSQRQRDDLAEGAITARIGLPWRTQFQVTAPLEYRAQNTGLGDGSGTSSSDFDVGDLQIEFAHQFLVENGWLPDIVAGVDWLFPTGSDPDKLPNANVATGSGANQGSVRLTALKSFDPLVFFSTVTYTHSLPYKESFGTAHLGDDFNWQVGGLLAVTPDTSLSFSFSQLFKERTAVNGQPIPGSDGVAGQMIFGVDQVITPKMLLDVSLGVGVTNDAPNYSLTVSLPIRF
jgi:hypothetical protein